MVFTTRPRCDAFPGRPAVGARGAPTRPGVTRRTKGRSPKPRTEPIAAPPITSVGWWARRWTRLAATAVANPTLAAVPASDSPRTKAVQKAARVWPLGKLLLVGVRTPASMWSSGRWRSTAAFTTRLTRSDEKPAAASATTARRRSGPRRRAFRPASSHPDEPVVGQVGDDGGGPVDLGAAPEGLEGGVDRLVDGAHRGPLTRRRRGRRP